MSSSQETILKGVSASPGITIGRALPVARRPMQVAYRHLREPHQIETEIQRFEAALAATAESLSATRDEMAQKGSGDYSYIIQAHLLILKDRMLAERTKELIREHSINAEWALSQAVSEAKGAFAAINDSYLRSRFDDVEYVSDHILRELSGQPGEELSEIREKVIVVAHDLSPADTSAMDLDWVLGFVTDMGGPTSHTAIVAQAKGIPAVVGLKRVSLDVKSGDFLIVDGSSGAVIINPEEETLHDYRERQEAYDLYTQEVLAEAHLPAVTTNGRQVGVEANIELGEEVNTALTYGGEGIGLYRTEFFYLAQETPPSEDELFENFKAVAQRLDGKPVTIRTFDLGGDKINTQDIRMRQQTNPALGLRAIRFCLQEQGILRNQLRAILRASAFGRVRVMFPLISGVGELTEARGVMEEVMAELDDRGEAYDRQIEVGIMMEVPSAVAIADLLAARVDFFSIGTNDLIQYSLAIDRVNEAVAHLYQPLHPAVLRMIRQVVQAGHEAGIPVAMCGEMAGDPKAVPLLLGLGLDTLSTSATSIPSIKQVIRQADTDLWRILAKEALSFPTAREVQSFIHQELRRHFPDLFGDLAG